MRNFYKWVLVCACITTASTLYVIKQENCILNQTVTSGGTMKMRKFLQNKLWRDKAPGMMEAIGSVIHVKNLTDAEYDVQLRTKLLEEAEEVQAAKSQDELMSEIADVYEVIDSLIKFHNIDKEAISVIQAQKREKRGGFEQRKYVTIAEHTEGGFGEAYCLADPLKYPEVTE